MTKGANKDWRPLSIDIFELLFAISKKAQKHYEQIYEI
jgi:hypothetical protein